jgi:hypothetical protein
MKARVEDNFKNQQALPFALTGKRRSVANGSPSAIKIDPEIEVCHLSPKHQMITLGFSACCGDRSNVYLRSPELHNLDCLRRLAHV